MAKEQTIEQRREAMCSRLERPARERGRSGSVASDVRACYNAIMTARIKGKTWAEIADDMYGDVKKADAVRAAYHREAEKRCATRADVEQTTSEANAGAPAIGTTTTARLGKVNDTSSTENSVVDHPVKRVSPERAGRSMTSSTAEMQLEAHPKAADGGASSRATIGHPTSQALFGSMNDARDEEAAVAARNGVAS